MIVLLFKIVLLILIFYYISMRLKFVFMRINRELVIRLANVYDRHPVFYHLIPVVATPRIIRYIIYFNPFALLYMLYEAITLSFLFRDVDGKKVKLTLKEVFDSKYNMLLVILNVTEENFKFSLDEYNDAGIDGPLYEAHYK